MLGTIALWDQLANAGASIPQDEGLFTFGITKAKIRALPWRVTHNRAMQTYGERRKPKYEVERKWPESVRRLFGRLRTGHAIELKSYAKFVGKEEDGSCPLCEMEDDKIQHVLCRCPGLEARRRKLSNEPFRTDMMVSQPELCRKLLEQRFSELAKNNQAQENTAS